MLSVVAMVFVMVVAVYCAVMRDILVIVFLVVAFGRVRIGSVPLSVMAVPRKIRRCDVAVAAAVDVTAVATTCSAAVASAVVVGAPRVHADMSSATVATSSTVASVAAGVAATPLSV